MLPIPTEVRLKSEQKVLEISWEDGHESRLSLAYLRGWCPCAVCQGHLHGVTRFHSGANAKLMDVEAVGAYAMRLRWADGHQTGIYAFRYLRAIEETPPADGPTNASLLAEGR